MNLSRGDERIMDKTDGYNIVDKMKQLKKLYEDGLIDEREYQEHKAKLIEAFSQDRLYGQRQGDPILGKSDVKIAHSESIENYQDSDPFEEKKSLSSLPKSKRIPTQKDMGSVDTERTTSNITQEKVKVIDEKPSSTQKHGGDKAYKQNASAEPKENDTASDNNREGQKTKKYLFTSGMIVSWFRKTTSVFMSEDSLKIGKRRLNISKVSNIKEELHFSWIILICAVITSIIGLVNYNTFADPIAALVVLLLFGVVLYFTKNNRIVLYQEKTSEKYIIDSFKKSPLQKFENDLKENRHFHAEIYKRINIPQFALLFLTALFLILAAILRNGQINKVVNNLESYTQLAAMEFENKPDRNGFSREHYQALDYHDEEFRIPEYFEMSSDEELDNIFNEGEVPDYMYYANESTGEGASIMFYYFDNMELLKSVNATDYREINSLIIYSFLEESKPYNREYTAKVLATDGREGVAITILTEDDGEPCYITGVYLYDKYGINRNAITAVMVQTENCSYNYLNDFYKLIESGGGIHTYPYVEHVNCWCPHNQIVKYGKSYEENSNLKDEKGNTLTFEDILSQNFNAVYNTEGDKGTLNEVGDIAFADNNKDIPMEFYTKYSAKASDSTGLMQDINERSDQMEERDSTIAYDDSMYASVIEEYYHEYGTNGSYSLFDLNNDGVKELIISYGNSPIGRSNAVYTIKDAVPVKLGEFPNSSLYYANNNGDGLISVYGHMGYQCVQLVTYDGRDVLRNVVIAEGSTGENPYYSNEFPIEQRELGDF